MHSISRRSILKAGLGAMPVMAAAQPLAAFGQTCPATPGQTTCNPAITTPTFLQQVATGCHLPDAEYLGVPSIAFRSPHFNRSGRTLKSLQIALPNRYGLSAPSSPKTWRARIEYPRNVITEVTWNCAPDVTSESPPATSLPYVLSDTITLRESIPDNALFWVRIWQQDSSAAALIYQNIGNHLSNPQNPIDRTINFALGETNSPGGWQLLDNPVLQHPTQNRWFFSDGGGAYTGVTEWATVRPLAILGQSRKPAFSLWGDSRVCGIGDAFDDVCDDRGEVERSIGPDYAYINFGIPGLQAASLWNDKGSGLFQQVVPQYNPWLVFGNYTTHLIEDLGGADCVFYADNKLDLDAQAIMKRKVALWDAWIGMGNRLPASLSTLTYPPYAGNPPANVYIKAFSDMLRAGINYRGTQLRILDVASIVATVNGSGQYVWSCSDYAADGLHESQAGCFAIHDSGIIDPAVFIR